MTAEDATRVALTGRQIDALVVLRDASGPMSPAGFAVRFWPDKEFARGNGPWGLGPDASGRHGGKMLTRLRRMGLIRTHDHYGYYTAEINLAGREALASGSYHPHEEHR